MHTPALPQANTLRNHVKRHGDFKRRYFVLDHHDLRYYEDAAQRLYKGHIDLGTVTELRESTMVDAPSFALDLVRGAAAGIADYSLPLRWASVCARECVSACLQVTDARVFTLVPATRELLEEWKHRVNHVVRECTQGHFPHCVCLSCCVCARTCALRACCTFYVSV